MNLVLLEKNCGDLKVTIKRGNKEMLQFPPSTTSALGLSDPTKNVSLICILLLCKPFPWDCGDNLQCCEMRNPHSVP